MKATIWRTTSTPRRRGSHHVGVTIFLVAIQQIDSPSVKSRAQVLPSNEFDGFHDSHPRVLARPGR
jgi:hypothetical protein